MLVAQHRNGIFMSLSTAEWISVAAVLASVFIGVISWFVSAALTRRSIDNKVLGYRMEVSPLMTTSLKSGGLKIEYRGEELPEPLLLTVEVFNLGNVSIENPPISIVTSGDATYIIPVQVEDPPPGYEDLWEIERSDAGQCKIHLAHINPGQIVKATFLMDEIPIEMPHFRCPLPNLIVKRVDPVDFAKLSIEIVGAAFPVARSIDAALKRIM